MATLLEPGQRINVVQLDGLVSFSLPIILFTALNPRNAFLP